METDKKTETTEQDPNLKYNEVWKMLDDAGFKFGDRFKIRNTFAEWGKRFDDDIELNHKYKTYISKKCKGFGFATEAEAKFFNALMDFSPDTDPHKIAEVMSIVTKLLDIESDWKFKKKE